MKAASTFLLSAVVLWLAFCGGPQVFGQTGQPNIILINLDDADYDVMSLESMFRRYPRIYEIAARGIHFSNLHVTTPLCGPSRACLLRAQYAHNTGIKVNNPGTREASGFAGGMRAYMESGHHLNDLSVWMQDLGYRTMLVGKYLHSDVVLQVPPGWDDFYVSLGGRYYGPARFTTRQSVDGHSELLPEDVYRTTVETSDSLGLIDEHMQRNDDTPFFLYLNPFSPHRQPESVDTPAVETKYQSWWPNARMPLTPDFNEREFADKTDVLSWLPELTTIQIETAEQQYRQRLRLMRSVDDMCGAIVAKLDDHGLTDNTYIFLTSDNGFHLGHKRLFGKSLNYDSCTNVPLYVCGPGIPPGREAQHLIGHIDIGPTIVELAGGAAPSFVDGRSFAELLFDPNSHLPDLWREPLLIESYQSKQLYGENVVLAATTLRTFDEAFTEWADGSSEYYDLAIDPLQMQNRIDDLSASEQMYFSGYMRALKQPLTDPEATISSPLTPEELVSELESFQGNAEDDTGVDRIMLTLKDADSNEYWNGTGWQPARVRVAATVTNAGHQLATWHYESVPPKRMSGPRNLVLFARAYDQAGNFDAQPTRIEFQLAADTPEIQISSPQPAEQVENPVTVGGRVSDDRPLQFMRVVIRHLDSRQYWTGSRWASTWSYLEPEIQSDLTWSLTQNLPSGDYVVSARIRDVFGNVHEDFPVVRFTVK